MRFLIATAFAAFLAFAPVASLAQETASCDTAEEIKTRMRDAAGAWFVKTVEAVETVEAVVGKLAMATGKSVDVPDALMVFVSPTHLIFVAIEGGCPTRVYGVPLGEKSAPAREA